MPSPACVSGFAAAERPAATGRRSARHLSSRPSRMTPVACNSASSCRRISRRSPSKATPRRAISSDVVRPRGNASIVLRSTDNGSSPPVDDFGSKQGRSGRHPSTVGGTVRPASVIQDLGVMPHVADKTSIRRNRYKGICQTRMTPPVTLSPVRARFGMSHMPPGQEMPATSGLSGKSSARDERPSALGVAKSVRRAQPFRRKGDDQADDQGMDTIGPLAHPKNGRRGLRWFGEVA